MGKKAIRPGGNGGNGAEGAYEQHRRELVRTVLDVINYLRSSYITVGGYTYGSEKLYTDPAAKAEMLALIDARHWERWGHARRLTDHETVWIYAGCRKGNYEKHRDGKAVDNEYYPLFGDDDAEAEPVATVYAFWGRSQMRHRWLVKIGYTADVLSAYLHRLKRQYDPHLLASKVGGRKEEGAEHARYARSLEDGREWFRPSEAMFLDFRSRWKVEPDFDERCRSILAQYEADEAREFSGR